MRQESCFIALEWYEGVSQPWRVAMPINSHLQDATVIFITRVSNRFRPLGAVVEHLGISMTVEVTNKGM